MLIALAFSLLVCLSAFIGIWLIHVWLGDAGVIDYYWAPGFLTISGAHAWSFGFNSGSALLFCLIALWAIRLTSHLVDRHTRMASEDARYAAMRAAGGPAFWWKSLFSIFLVQGVLQWIIASPIHVVAVSSAYSLTAPLVMIGLAFFSIGFAIEVIADWQLRTFRFSAKARGQVMQSGLWARSRHPNYFGEMVLWSGLGLIAYAISGSLMAFAGPAVLVFAVTFVSIPLTEQHLRASRPDFVHYAARTPMLVPKIW